MLKYTSLLFTFFIFNSLCTNKKNAPDYSYTIVIHGGAGTIKKKNMTPELEEAFNNTLKLALQTGVDNLKKGGTAVNTVEMVIKILEDSPLFNAGKGAVFNHEGFNEMDASIMDGKDLSCGAISGITNLKNPIEGARIVKDSTKHVFLYGKRAQDFCITKGAKKVDSSYFYTDHRWNQLQKALKKNSIELDHNGDQQTASDIKKFGTVGCVVKDSYGNLAAGTSTGGLTNKQFGRIGDSPIIGAGTYADNNSCAVSCTGTGEYFIRGTIARDLAAIYEYKKVSLKKAAKKTMKKLNTLGGKGGFIAIDKKGNYTLNFNTRGMFRGAANSNGTFEIKIYND